MLTSELAPADVPSGERSSTINAAPIVPVAAWMSFINNVEHQSNYHSSKRFDDSARRMQRSASIYP
jgi:hypothetical protein